MKTMKTWYLTFNNRTTNLVIAPTEEAAIMKVGKGDPATIDEIETSDEKYKVYKTLCKLRDNIDTLVDLLGY
jgi:hypothetical protein